MRRAGRRSIERSKGRTHSYSKTAMPPTPWDFLPRRVTPPEARTYRRVMESPLDSGAVAVPLIRDRGFSGSTVYEITTHGVEMLHEAGRIA